MRPFTREILMRTVPEVVWTLTNSRGRGFFEEVAIDLRIHVVEIRFDDGNLFVEAGDGFFRSVADHDADDIGLAFEIGRARAVTDGVDTHRWLRTEGIAKRGNDGRAR